MTIDNLCLTLKTGQMKTVFEKKIDYRLISSFHGKLFDEDNLYEEKLIVSFILPNSIISVLNNFENGDVICEVNNIKNNK